VGYKYLRPTLWRVIIPPARHELTPIPRCVDNANQFLEYFHDDITTTSLECDEILNNSDPSIASLPTIQRLPRTPPLAYTDSSYATNDTSAIVTLGGPHLQNKGCLSPRNKGCLMHLIKHSRCNRPSTKE
jgi:hypothetical protein